jgi:hypothetical protein
MQTETLLVKISSIVPITSNNYRVIAQHDLANCVYTFPSVMQFPCIVLNSIH